MTASPVLSVAAWPWGEALVSVAATPADLAQMTGQGTATRLL
jgi:hypothetical protein